MLNIVEQIKEIAENLGLTIFSNDGELRLADGALTGAGLHRLPAGWQPYRLDGAEKEYLAPISNEFLQDVELFLKIESRGEESVMEEITDEIGEIRAKCSASPPNQRDVNHGRITEAELNRYHELLHLYHTVSYLDEDVGRLDISSEVAERVDACVEHDRSFPIHWHEVFGTWRPVVYRHHAAYAVRENGWQPVSVDGDYNLNKNAHWYDPQDVISGGVPTLLEASDPSARKKNVTIRSVDGEDQTVRVLGGQNGHGHLVAQTLTEDHGRSNQAFVEPLMAG